MRYIFLIFLLPIISCSQPGGTETREVTAYEKLKELKLPPKPNILWITIEDQMPTLGCFGDEIAVTPNIDKLSSEGIRFTNLFSTAGVCAPARSSIITGMYQTSIGTHHMRTTGLPKYQPVPTYAAVIPEKVKCYSEYLRMNGYYCTNNSKEDYQFYAPVTAWDESSRKAHYKNRPKDKPFFAIFNITVCHESGMWFNQGHPLRVDPAKVKVPDYYPDNDIVRQQIARNYSNLYEMDSIAGRIIDELKEEGLYNNTVIFFYSDHGGPLPRQKREIYDTGLKAPMVIRFPDQQMAGTVVDELLSFVDFAPTLLSMTNYPVPDYIQGQAFLGSQQATPRKYIFAARDRLDDEYDMVRAVRDNRFKYLKNYQPEKPYIMDIEYRMQMDLMPELIRAHEEGELNEVQELWFAESKPEEEFYDLENDPWELNNLIENPDHKEKINELRTALSVWQDDVGDMGFIEENEMIKQMWKGGEKAPDTAPPIVSKEGKMISISCQTKGASIGYKILNKDEESATWEVYSEPFELKGKEKLRVIAHRIGYYPAEVNYDN